MIVQILASGSRGNSTYIESGGDAILIDCGLSARETRRRLESAGRPAESLRGIFITHDHQDHISGARVLSRQLDIPVYMAGELFDTMDRHKWLRDIDKIRLFDAGTDIDLDFLRLHALEVSHDASHTVNYTITDGHRTAGIFTDLGIVSQTVLHHARQADLLIAEANHDLNMLAAGPYPLWLQQRVRSNRGHLSNAQCGNLISDAAEAGKVREIILAHLSEKNNDPGLALNTAEKRLKAEHHMLPVTAAEQHRPMKPIEL